jgi:hypothetical protein
MLHQISWKFSMCPFSSDLCSWSLHCTSIQKFPDWLLGARTANCTALCHQVQLYRYFMSQSSEFCRHNPLCCFSTSVYCSSCYFVIDSVRKLLDTLSYTICSRMYFIRLPCLCCQWVSYYSKSVHLSLLNSFMYQITWGLLNQSYWYQKRIQCNSKGN